MRKSVIVFLMIGCCGQANADIYKKIVSADGVITYTNKAPTNFSKPVVKSVSHSVTPTSGYFYKYQDSSKNIIYTDKPRSDVMLVTKMKVTVPAMNTQTATAFSSPYTSTVASFYTNPNKTKFNALIAQVAARHKVDAKLVHAVIQAESAYRPDAISSAGAVGLMQLMPATASQFGVSDITNPEQNIDGGTRYLKHLIDLFPNSLHLAIAAYNAGENSVLRYNYSIPPYPETQNYVKQVLAIYNQKS